MAMTCNLADQDLTQQEVTPASTTHEVHFVEDVNPESLFDSWNKAYGPNHPDHVTGEKQALINEHLAPLLDHSELGPNHRASITLVDNEMPIAAIIISLREGHAPFGGPWVSEIWVDPHHQGEGIAQFLIVQAKEKLAKDGFTSLGLAVTNGNPAKSLYATAGFTTVKEFWTLKLPTV